LVPGGYTGCVQVLDKVVNKTFKHYTREEFESWMVSNGSSKKTTRGEVSKWIQMAWDKVMTATIINTWKSIRHKAGDEEDGETIIQNDQQEDEQGGQEEQYFDNDDGGDLPLEEEPLFRWSNLMEVNNEEPLFVLELTPEQKEEAREFHAPMAENITKV
jgi:hypothetical protein